METLEHLDADCETDAISDIQPVQNVTPNVRQASRSVNMVLIDRLYIYDLLLVFHCKYISVLCRFRNIISSA